MLENLLEVGLSLLTLLSNVFSLFFFFLQLVLLAMLEVREFWLCSCTTHLMLLSPPERNSIALQLLPQAQYLS